MVAKYSWVAAVAFGLTSAAICLADEPAVPVQLAERILVPGNSEIDDPLEPLVPRAPRTEEELDRIDAMALFAAARTAEDQGDERQALRLYQRAYRRDPESVAALKQIVPLAFQLQQTDSAFRYTVKLAERGEPDLQLLRQLGEYLAVQGGDDTSAIRLLEKAVEVSAKAENPGEQYLHLARLVRVYHRAGDNAKAAAALVRVEDALAARKEHQLDDETVEAILGEPDRSEEMFGEIYLAAGQFERARTAFERAYAANEDEPSRAFRAAQIAFQEKNDEEALRQLDQYFAAKVSTRHAAPYRLLNEVYKRQERAAEQISKLEGLHAANPTDEALSEYLAEQYLAAQSWEPAEKLLSELFAGKDFYGPAAGLIEVYRETKRTEKLLNVLAKVSASEPGLEMLSKRVADLAAAPETMDGLILAARARVNSVDQPLDFGGAYAVATLGLEAKRMEIAQEFFEQAIALAAERQGEVALTWGLGLMMAEDYAGAVKVLQRGIDDRLLPDGNPAFHYYLSGALEMSGETEKALEAAREAAKSAELDPRLAVREPWILYHAKRYDEALAKYSALIESADDEHGSSSIRDIVRDARLAISNVHVIQKDFPAAEESLEQVLDEFPDDVGASNDLGYLWADQGKRLPQSLAMLQHAVSKAPENAAYRDSLGWVLHRLGRNEEALVEIDLSAKEKDADGVILDHLGDVHQALGHADQAKEAWTKAVAAFERDKELEQAETVRKKLTP
ncbi:MAG: tetratricopeptide repeat protein [Planctomycetia bacterium]|nr:tetratricopeptide repeat protein [Planctomycetia bacterium]